MATVDFDVQFIDPDTGLGVQALPVQVAIYNSLNEHIETFVFPTVIAETEITQDNWQYSVSNYDTTGLPGDFIHVLWGAEVLGTPLEDIGYNVPIAPSATPPDYSDFTEPYVEMDYANEYFGLTFDGDQWLQYTESDRQKALYTASDDLDQLDYIGHKSFAYVAEDRQRQWPRVLPFYLGGFFEEDQVPSQIRKATCEQALWILKNRNVDPQARADLQAQGVTGLSRLNSSENWDLNRRRKHRVCPKAFSLVSPYIFRGGKI